jgi:hypothetical protein
MEVILIKPFFISPFNQLAYYEFMGCLSSNLLTTICYNSMVAFGIEMTPNIAKEGGIWFVNKNIRQKIGFTAAMVGLVLAFFAGIFVPYNGIVVLVLMILGILVGALSVNTREIILLLVASIALIVLGNTGFNPLNYVFDDLGNAIDSIVNYFAKLMAPAAVISAVRALIDVAKNP